MLKIALIGAGAHCRGNHAPALQRLAADHPGRIELSAVCDIVREKAETFAKAYGFRKAYTDVAEMLDRAKPDGCVCVMAIEHTAAMAIDLMKRGVPCTVEKPMGSSLDEIRGIVRAARETGTPNMVSVNRRFEPLIRKGLDWAKATGPIRYVRASILRHNRREPTFVSGTGIHCIDTLRFLAGDFASREQTILDGEPLWHHVTFRHTTGVTSTLDVLPTEGSVEERYEIFGEGYRVDARVGPSPAPRLRCWLNRDIVVDERPAPGEPDYVRVGPYGEAEEFVKALEEKRMPWPTVPEVFPSVEMAFGLDPEMR